MKLIKLLLSFFLLCSSLGSIAQELLEIGSIKKFQEQYDNHINAAILTTDGHHLITGYTLNNSAGGKDLWVAKLSRSGQMIWQQTFGDINNDEGTDLV